MHVPSCGHRGQRTAYRSNSLIPPIGFWGPNSGHQDQQKVLYSLSTLTRLFRLFHTHIKFKKK